MMIDDDPSHDKPKPAQTFDVLVPMLATALIGVALVIFGTR